MRPLKDVPGPAPRLGLVVDADRVLFADGQVVAVDEVEEGAVLYSWADAVLFARVRSGDGRVRVWARGGRGGYDRVAYYQVAGRDIRPLRDALSDLDEHAAVAALQEWGAWVHAHGGSAVSPASASWAIWRRTLRAPLLIAGRTERNHGAPHGLPEDVLPIGGRQECYPGTYYDVAAWDIRAAYPATLATLPVPARYTRVRGCSREHVGFARARVVLPYAEWGPLPVRVGRRQVFQRDGSTVEGVWDIAELRAAAEAGAQVDVLEAWRGVGIVRPWRAWFAIMLQGRALSPGAAKLAKVTANALWGSFASAGRGAWVHYVNGRPVVIPDAEEREAECLPVAAHLTAALRVRLYREVLAALGSDVHAVHTDGALLPMHAEPAGLLGPGPGEWSIRETASRVDLVQAQVYRMECTDGRVLHRVSGVRRDRAEKAFYQVRRWTEKGVA